MGINIQPSPGYPTHYIEWHICLSLAFQAHLVSFLTEGVFERFPGFRIVLVEGGVTWLPALMWRLDAEWKALRSEVPWVTKPPSTYLRDHVHITSQAIERPDDDRHLLQMLEMLDVEHLLMFSSDYPHWDFDSPTHAFPRLPEALRQRIFHENARAFYARSWRWRVVRSASSTSMAASMPCATAARTRPPHSDWGRSRG